MAARSTGLVVPALASTIVGVLPVFLLGGLAPFVRADLGFDEAILGMIASSFYGFSALAAMPAGGLADRLGARTGLTSGVLLGIASLSVVAGFGTSVTILVGCMIIAGASNAILQPAANLALIRGVGPGRVGIAFGVKQSAVPGASLLAGLAVPAIALTFGWRWAYAGAAALALVLLIPLVGPRASDRPTRRTHGGAVATLDRADRRRLARIGASTGCGFFAATSLGVFYVESAETAGIGVGLAGILLSAGSALSIAVRLLRGWRADRVGGDHLMVAGVMMLVGAVGFAALGHASSVWLLLLATVTAFGAGWGWTGLIHLGVVQAHPDAPATASGIVNTGSLVGALTGPTAFGAIATRAGYLPAWTTVGVVALLGGALLVWDRSRNP